LNFFGELKRRRIILVAIIATVTGLTFVGFARSLHQAEAETSKTDAFLPTKAYQSAEQPVLANSIAVLPFENLSPNTGDAYFAEGVHEVMLNQLAKIKDISVIGSKTMTRYTQSNKTIHEIATELNVGAVMEGSVHYTDGKVRITVQLIDGVTGTHLLSETYDSDLLNIHAIKLDIAIKITDALNADFSTAEQEAIGGVLTVNPEAYHLYLRALSQFSQSKPNLRATLNYLENAISLDANFAAALALRAYYFVEAMNFVPGGPPLSPESQAQNALQAATYADRALAIDPSQAAAYIVRSRLDDVKRRWTSSLPNVARAYQLNPNKSQVIWEYGYRRNLIGKTKEAISLMDRAIALNPQDISLPLFSAFQLVLSRQWGDAMRFSHDAIAMAPNIFSPYLQLAAAAGWSGDRELALDMAKETEARLQGIPVANPYIVLMDIYTRFGMDDDADRMLSRVYEIDKIQPLDDALWLYVYAIRREKEKAFKYLNAIIDNNFPYAAVVRLLYFPDIPLLDGIRADPRFEEARIKLRSAM
jgi:TolB-like protein